MFEVVDVVVKERKTEIPDWLPGVCFYQPPVSPKLLRLLCVCSMRRNNLLVGERIFAPAKMEGMQVHRPHYRDCQVLSGYAVQVGNDTALGVATDEQ